LLLFSTVAGQQNTPTVPLRQQVATASPQNIFQDAPSAVCGPELTSIAARGCTL